MSSFFYKDPAGRRWLLTVIVVTMIFMLLAWIAWLYYDFEMTRLMEQKRIMI